MVICTCVCGVGVSEAVELTQQLHTQSLARVLPAPVVCQHPVIPIQVQVICVEKSEELIPGDDVRLIEEEQLLRHSVQKIQAICEKHACP